MIIEVKKGTEIILPEEETSFVLSKNWEFDLDPLTITSILLDEMVIKKIAKDF